MKLWLLGTSFVLFLVALPLISWGAWQDFDGIWYAGLGLVGVAAVLPPVTRFLDKDDKGRAGKGSDDQASGDKGSDEKRSKDAGGKPAPDHKAAQRGAPQGGAGGAPGTSPGGAPRRQSERARMQQKRAREAEGRTKER